MWWTPRSGTPWSAGIWRSCPDSNPRCPPCPRGGSAGSSVRCSTRGGTGSCGSRSPICPSPRAPRYLASRHAGGRPGGRVRRRHGRRRCDRAAPARRRVAHDTARSRGAAQARARRIRRARRGGVADGARRARRRGGHRGGGHWGDAGPGRGLRGDAGAASGTPGRRCRRPAVVCHLGRGVDRRVRPGPRSGAGAPVGSRAGGRPRRPGPLGRCDRPARGAGGPSLADVHRRAAVGTRATGRT